MHKRVAFLALVVLVALLAACSNPAPTAISVTTTATVAAPTIMTPATIAPTNAPMPAPTGTTAATVRTTTAPNIALTPAAPSRAAADAPTTAPPAALTIPTPTPPRAPFKPAITKLTDGGCCRNPVWHPDGTRILYTDAIPDQQLAGTYAVPADGTGAPVVFWPSVAEVSPDGSRVAFPDFAARVTRLQEVGKQSVATLNNDAAYVWFSRDGRQVAWLARAPGAQPSSNVDRLVNIWVANADGANARVVGATVRAGELTWFPDGQRLLFTGRDRDGGSPGIYTLDLASGALTQIIGAFSPRGVRLAPDGGSLVYLAALEEKPEDNGLFIARADGTMKRKIPLIGAVRWLPDSTALVIVPTQTDNGPDQLVRIDAATLATTTLTDRAALPFRIAQDEWQLAPDGTRIVFTSLTDGTIYALRFAP